MHFSPPTGKTLLSETQNNQRSKLRSAACNLWLCVKPRVTTCHHCADMYISATVSVFCMRPRSVWSIQAFEQVGLLVLANTTHITTTITSNNHSLQLCTHRAALSRSSMRDVSSDFEDEDLSDKASSIRRQRISYRKDKSRKEQASRRSAAR